MQTTVKETYTDFHVSHNPAHVYPSEWIIRTLLGNYPGLSLDRSKYAGAKILDVGFGDGQNWPLLKNASFDIYGVEITEKIIALGHERARNLGIPVTLKLGTNTAIPFEDDFLAYILASCTCPRWNDLTPPLNAPVLAENSARKGNSVPNFFSDAC